MNKLKLQLRIHRLALLFFIVLWGCGLAELWVFISARSWLALYPWVAMTLSVFIGQRMYSHCKWFKHLIGLVPVFEAAKSIPFPDFPAKHRNIRYVQKHKVKKY